MQVVYRIRNKITEDIYIGSAVKYDYRIWAHLSRLRKGTHHSKILQNAFNKYGESIFEFSVLEQVHDKQKLIEREQYYLDTLKPKYNISKKAGSPLGIKHSLRSRINMSRSHIGMSKEERGHKVECKCCICKRPTGIKSYRWIKREERICKCGCRNKFICTIKSSQRYINGHNKSQLGRKKTMEEIDKQKTSILKYYVSKRNNRARIR